MNLIAVRTLAALAAAMTTASGQTLTMLPPGASGFGKLSQDGTFVTGQDSLNGGAYLWSAAGGLISLGEVDGVAVSSDGTKVFGNITSLTNQGEAGIFDIGSFAWTSLGTFATGSACGTLASAYDMSDDGMVATGLAWENCQGRAFYWNGTTMLELPQLGFSSARGNAVSGDGRYIGGWDQSAGGTRRAAVWDTLTMTEVLPLVTPTDSLGAGETWGFSTDGRFVVGQASGQAWRWDRVTNKLIKLGSLPGAAAADIGIARAVSDDGKTVVGLSGAPFGTPWRGWIWTEDVGIQELATYLPSLGFTIPGPIYGAADLSADGRTLLGANANFIGFAGDGWVLDLPPVTNLGGASLGTNGLAPRLSATGAMVGTTPFSLYIDDARASSIGILFLSGVDNPVPLVGGVFHTPIVFASLSPLPIDANGKWQLSLNWPSGLPSSVSLYMQAVVADPGAQGGLTLTNALVITTP